MILVETYKGKAVTDHPVEIVERKGKGHPDYICDAVMEAISVAISQHYLASFGTILHHNIDKSLLAAGRVEKHFGGGQVLKPMELIIGDRATFNAAGQNIPVSDIAVATAQQWLKENMRLIDPQQHVDYRVVLAPGSTELTDIFQRPGAVRAANDTSAAIGYYPLSPTEQAVLALEQHLNSKEFKARYPETGEDIKIMGLRRGRRLDMTVAMPLIATHIHSEADYFERKEIILDEMRCFLERFNLFSSRDIWFNCLDAPGRGLGGTYLSLLGTSAEDADSGQVGRGNRVNGLISINRPMGTEAAAGKNPVSHVGKIYNVLAHRIAREIFETTSGVKEDYVLLLSRIGVPVNLPHMAAAQLLLERGRKINEIKPTVKAIFEQELSDINCFCLDLAAGKYPIC